VSERDEGTPIPDLEGPLPGKVITGDAQEGIVEPLDRPRAADRYGTTAEEERRGASLDARVSWEEPDTALRDARDVEASEFDSADELDVDPFALDTGAFEREHAAPLEQLGVDARPGIDAGRDDLGPAPDGLAAAARATSRHDLELDALSDDELRQRIDQLVDDREQCLQRADHDAAARVDIELDRLWDLLRQRRARRDAGADPGAAHVRPAAVVESYEQ
jgi:Protein of unknown function (DUF2630)